MKQLVYIRKQIKKKCFKTSPPPQQQKNPGNTQGDHFCIFCKTQSLVVCVCVCMLSG